MIKLLWHLIPFFIRNKIYHCIRFVDEIINKCYDFHYNIRTTLNYKPGWNNSYFNDSSRIMSTSYLLLRKIEQYLKITPSDVFVDLGCGTGRVVFWFSHTQVKKASGIELNSTALKQFKLNKTLTLNINKSKIEIRNEDAAKTIFRDETIFFLYNPFGIETFKAFIKNILDSVEANPRQITIIYYNPVHDWYLDTLSQIKKIHEITSSYLRDEVHIYANDYENHN